MTVNKKILVLIATFILFVSVSCSQEEVQTITSIEGIVKTEELKSTEQVITQPIRREIFLAPEGAEESLVDSIQTLLPGLERSYGMEFEPHTAVDQNTLEQSNLVIAISPADIVQLSKTAPNVKFLGVGYSDIQPTDNVSVITNGAEIVENTAFLAGYLSALITTDYRVGVLIQSNSEEGKRTEDSFYIGAQYFCGLCGSKYTPIKYYPKSAQINDLNNETDWKSAIDTLVAESVQAVYLPKEIYSTDLINYVFERGINIVSANIPPKGVDTGRWISTLEPDYNSAINQYIRDLPSLTSGMMIIPEVILTHDSSGLISEGRQMLFEETRSNLMAGFILPSPAQ